MSTQMMTTGPARVAARPLPAGRPLKARLRRMRAWLFMLPLIVVNLLVIAVPSIEAVYYSFTNWTGYGKAKFIGFANFKAMLTSNEFWQACFHNVLWTIFFLIV